MLRSIRSQGVELLAAPVRVVAVEDGEPSHWDENYPENEAESFIQRRSDEEIIVCGAKQSDRFIVDSCTRIGYDGGVDIDLKLMPRGGRWRRSSAWRRPGRCYSSWIGCGWKFLCGQKLSRCFICSQTA